jgi:arylsulfatase A-like enzyme
MLHRHSSLPFLLAAASIAALATTVRAADVSDSDKSRKPHVLILGDSISIGYTPFVRDLLEDDAVVIRPMRTEDKPENCSGTNNGVKQMDRWLKLGDGRWDVIHFNFGLHDLKRVDPQTGKNSKNPEDPHQADPDRYERQVRNIVQKLAKTGATLIFATTTPVPPGAVNPYRDVTDPPRYNNVARKIMAEHDVAINDLYAFAAARLDKIQRPANVHFTPDGSEQLAQQVVRHIRPALAASKSLSASSRPNILWLIVEDMSAHFGCYGETTIETPHVDALATAGVKFTNAFITAPVCSAARSALITGMYQTSIGSHHHRSGRGRLIIHLPENVKLIPELFHNAGYYTTNGYPNNPNKNIAKTDYNFAWNPAVYNGNDWAGRRKGQPFFAQIQLHGGKMRHGGNFSDRVKKELGNVTPTDRVQLPPHYPADPVILDDWAQYLDAVRYTDMEVGQILKRLDDEGLADNTYVFFITDHGISHARGKQFCYDEGIRIPFILRGPKNPHFKPGSVRDDLITHIDMAATSLALAGIDVPDAMQARDVFANDYAPADFVVSARDRCDETVDRIRSVRTKRYKYIRNFYPHRPYLQPNRYKDQKPIIKAMRRLFAAGKLDPVQSLIMASSRPEEELYDIAADPHEIHNLAADPKHRETLARLRSNLDQWISDTGDRAQSPESPAMYDSDMAVYLTSGHPEQKAVLEANIAQMKKWAAEGQ